MVETIQWTDAGVVMIDQTRLPREQNFVTCRTYLEVADAIKTMVIRGAPAIGVAAAMGVALGVQEGADFETVCKTLAATRPTAVNLFWGIERMRNLMRRSKERRARNIVRSMISRSQADSAGRHRHLPGHRPQRRTAGSRWQDRADALQRGRARHGGIRHGAGRDPRGRQRRQEDRRLRRRDASVSPGRAPHRVGAAAGRDRHHRDHR